jgi:hypothetical protein
MLAVGCGAAGALLPAGLTPNVKVHINDSGLHTEMQTGHDVEALHYDVEGFKGQKPGYFVLRREDDWIGIWKDARPDQPRPPPPPRGVDWDNKLMLVTTATATNATKVTIDRVIATENNALQVYVTEEVPGDGCPTTLPKDSPIDIVIASKPVDDVTYWIDRDKGSSCGNRPNARVECKVLNAPGEPTDKLTVQSGQTITCDGSKSDAGSARSIMDRNWYFTLAPAGSTSKLRIEGGKTATFLVDAYGTYTVRLEVSDNEGRSSDAVATILVPPPDETTVQLGWAHITAQDDPDTFPRIELQIAQTGSAVACTTATDVRPAWCHMDHLAALTRVKVDPTANRNYKFRVRYTDERFQGGPMVCLRVFPKGQKPAEVCDDNRRKQQEVWDVGFLDLEQGSFSDKEPAPKPKPDATKPDTTTQKP